MKSPSILLMLILSLFLLAGCSNDLPPEPDAPGVTGNYYRAIGGWATEPNSFSVSPDRTTCFPDDVISLTFSSTGADFTFERLYLWDEVAQEWDFAIFDGQEASPWVSGDASYTITDTCENLANLIDSDNEAYAVAYSCTKSGSNWDCNENKWQLEIINITVQITPEVPCLPGDTSCNPEPVLETCTDGVQNQDETGVDCGGSICAACYVPPSGDLGTYPDLEVFEPVDISTAPFSSYVTYPVDEGNYNINSAAPQIAELIKTNNPGDTLPLTAENLESDSSFLTFGNGVLDNATVELIDGQTAAITLSSNLPENEVYMLWPKNSHGFGNPVMINRPEAWWVGPEKTVVGEDFFVHGSNLVSNRESPISYIFIEKADGSACGLTDCWLTSLSADPYRAKYDSAGLEVGTYVIYVHNGKGAKYGWSEESIELEIVNPTPWTGQIFDVTDFGADGSDREDDYDAITRTIAAAKAVPFSTIYFPEGTYTSSEYIKFGHNVIIKGAGRDLTTLQPHKTWDALHQDIKYNYFLNGALKTVIIEDITISQGDESGEVLYALMQLDSSNDVTFQRVKVTQKDMPYRANPAVMDLKNSYLVNIKDSVIEQAGALVVANADQVFIDNVTFFGFFDVNQMIGTAGGKKGFSLTNTIAKPFDDSDPVDGYGWAKRWLGLGRISNVYVANNVVDGIGPRLPSDLKGDYNLVSASPREEWYYCDGEPAPCTAASLECWINDDSSKYNYHTSEFVCDGTDCLDRKVCSENSCIAPRICQDVQVSGLDFNPAFSTPRMTASFEALKDGEPAYFGLPFLPERTDISAGKLVLERNTWQHIFELVPSTPVAIKESVDQNSGELVLSEGPRFSYSGYAHSAEKNSLTLTDAINSFSKGDIIFVVSGKGLGQVRIVESFDGNKVYLNKPWTVIPDGASLIKMGSTLSNLAIYNNSIKGNDFVASGNSSTASAGISLYAAGYNYFADSNRIDTVNQGIDSWLLRTDNIKVYGRQLLPNYFNLFSNNQISNTVKGLVVPIYLTSDTVAAPAEVGLLGNVFRKNSVVGTHGGSHRAAGVPYDVKVSETNLDLYGHELLKLVVLDKNTYESANPIKVMNERPGSVIDVD